MKRLLTINLAIVILLSAALVCADPTETELFSFAKKEMKMYQDIPMPEIVYVPKSFLQRLWASRNTETHSKWTESIGKEEADKLWKRYMDELIGLFDPRFDPDTIYIGEFLEGCKQASILVHEMVHYLQNYNEGGMDGLLNQTPDGYFFAEMQAGIIEEKYYEMCNE